MLARLARLAVALSCTPVRSVTAATTAATTTADTTAGTGQRTGGAVAVASSLRFAWPALVAAAGTPTLRATFGASRTLAQQMRLGAPFELLLSADAESIALLVDAGLADARGMVEYAHGRLVLVVRDGADGQAGPASLAALPAWLDADPARRIAIAHPDHAPYGRAALQTLASLGVAPLAPDRLVRGENAAQALQFFAAGAAPVALLPASLVREAAADLLAARGVRTRELPIDPGLHEPLRHRAVAVRRAGPAARRLLAALREPAVQRTLAATGLEPVPARPASPD